MLRHHIRLAKRTPPRGQQQKQYGRKFFVRLRRIASGKTRARRIVFSAGGDLARTGGHASVASSLGRIFFNCSTRGQELTEATGGGLLLAAPMSDLLQTRAYER